MSSGYGRPAVQPHYDRAVDPRQLDDPGNAGHIGAVTGSYVLLRSGNSGGETRTLGDPLYEGQELDLFFETDLGDVVITADSPVNQTGNNTLTFAAAGDHLRLVGARAGGGAREWRVRADGTPGNDGVALSTV